jgi:hypothetical protein
METVINLGWAMARIKTEHNSITIVSPADQIGEDYVPPYSIYIQGKENIEALRDAIIKAYPIE